MRVIVPICVFFVNYLSDVFDVLLELVPLPVPVAALALAPGTDTLTDANVSPFASMPLSEFDACIAESAVVAWLLLTHVRFCFRFVF